MTAGHDSVLTPCTSYRVINLASSSSGLLLHHLCPLPVTVNTPQLMQTYQPVIARAPDEGPRTLSGRTSGSLGSCRRCLMNWLDSAFDLVHSCIGMNLTAVGFWSSGCNEHSLELSRSEPLTE